MMAESLGRMKEARRSGTSMYRANDATPPSERTAASKRV